MYDSTIHRKTIARQFRRSDFEEGILHVPLSDKEATIQRALAIAASGFANAALYRSQLGTKYVYQHRSVEQALLIRHISENIRRVTGVRQGDRQAIVKSLVRLAGQGVAFKILKLDIHSFYESVDVDKTLDLITGDAAFSRQSVHLLRSFFDCLDAQHIPGLPRGLSISATLAEYLMRGFDAAASSFNGVWFYSRFVDDVIFVLDPEAEFDTIIEGARKHLPVGLEFKRDKTKRFSFSPYVSGTQPVEEGSITFLGYVLGISSIYRKDRSLRRNVKVDIAASKVSRTKRRVVKAILKFNDGGEFSDLLDRVKMLTSNHLIIDYDTGQPRFVGLRYNYPLVDAAVSDALTELDRFLLNAVVNKHPSNRIRPDFDATQRKRILGLTFRSGFEENRFFTFDDEAIRRTTGCWAHA